MALIAAWMENVFKVYFSVPTDAVFKGFVAVLSIKEEEREMDGCMKRVSHTVFSKRFFFFFSPLLMSLSFSFFQLISLFSHTENSHLHPIVFCVIAIFSIFNFQVIYCHDCFEQKAIGSGVKKICMQTMFKVLKFTMSPECLDWRAYPSTTVRSCCSRCTCSSSKGGWQCGQSLRFYSVNLLYVIYA